MKDWSSFIKKISHISDKIAGIFIVLVMVLVVANVLLKEVFNHPIKGTYELVGLLTAIAVALALGYCALQKGHIAVGFIMEKLSEKTQIIVSFFNHIMGLILWGTATTYLAKYGVTMMEKGLVTSTAEIPIYPFIYLIAYGYLVFSLAMVVTLKEDIKAMKRRRVALFKIQETVRKDII